MQTIYLCLLGYILGSIPTGKIVGTIRGIDIQKKGSGNIGFANVTRVLGWKVGIVVLFADVLKGLIPVYLAKYYFDASIVLQMVVGLAPILGHAFPVWLRFKGGKSIATGFGVLIAINIQIAIAAVAIYLVVFAVSKKSAFGSLSAAWSLPLLALLVQPVLFIYFMALALFATYTHRVNIRQLLYERAQ